VAAYNGSQRHDSKCGPSSYSRPSLWYAGAPGAGSPFYAYELLIADRGNNRLLLIDDTGQILWRYSSHRSPAPPGGFYFPDDAFFIRHGTAIISNQEENDTIVEVGFPLDRLLFSYGHPRMAGAGGGFLNNPDDAYCSATVTSPQQTP
jgi:hypothetical protein